MAFAQVWSGT